MHQVCFKLPNLLWQAWSKLVPSLVRHFRMLISYVKHTNKKANCVWKQSLKASIVVIVLNSYFRRQLRDHHSQFPSKLYIQSGHAVIRNVWDSSPTLHSRLHLHIRWMCSGMIMSGSRGIRLPLRMNQHDCCGQADHRSSVALRNVGYRVPNKIGRANWIIKS